MREPIYAWEEEMLRQQERFPLEKVELIFKPYTQYIKTLADKVINEVYPIAYVPAGDNQAKFFEVDLAKVEQQIMERLEDKKEAQERLLTVQRAEAVQRAAGYDNYSDVYADVAQIIKNASMVSDDTDGHKTYDPDSAIYSGTITHRGVNVYADADTYWNSKPDDYLSDDVPQRALIKWKDQRGGQARFEKWEPMGKEKALAMLQSSYPKQYENFLSVLRYGREIETKNYYLKLERY